MEINDKEITLVVTVSLDDWNGSRLSVHEHLKLSSLNFSEMASLLIEFQSVTEEFKSKIANLRELQKGNS